MRPFADEYAALERDFQRQVVKDRGIDGLAEHQQIWLPMTFLPSAQPHGAVDMVFVGMYPSQNWLTASNPVDKLAQANQRIADGFRISVSTIWDVVFHLAIREFLLRDGETYYVTDISKGAMEPKDEKHGRLNRWHRWYPLLKRDIELVVGESPDGNERVIPVSRDVADFLNEQGFAGWLEDQSPARLTRRITHWAAAWRQPPPRGGSSTFFHDYGKRIRSLAADLFKELDVAPWWAQHVEENVKKGMADGKTEWQRQWLFEKYRSELSEIAGLGPGGRSDPGRNGGHKRFSGTWELAAQRVAKRHGLNVQDKRQQGGCYWISDGPNLGDELQQLGFRFSAKKAAWWRR